jgi:hypothetical protein
MLLFGMRNKRVSAARITEMETIARFRSRLLLNVLCMLRLEIICQVLERYLLMVLWELMRQVLNMFLT